MIDPNKILSLKTELENNKNEQIRLKERHNMLIDNLKTEHKIFSIEELKTSVAALDKEVAELKLELQDMELQINAKLKEII